MTTKPTLIEIDPNGAWRRNRFDFCNALEAVVDSNSPENRAELKRLGVHVDAIGKPTIHYVRAKGATVDEIREHMRASPLYAMGDCILVWVNEGDFWLNLPREIER